MENTNMTPNGPTSLIVHIIKYINASKDAGTLKAIDVLKILINRMQTVLIKVNIRNLDNFLYKFDAHGKVSIIGIHR